MWQKKFPKNKNPRKILEIGRVQLNIPFLSLIFAFWRNLAPAKKKKHSAEYFWVRKGCCCCSTRERGFWYKAQLRLPWAERKRDW
jgi:hypothetical protein